MHSIVDVNPDLGCYFTHDNILVYDQPIQISDLIHDLLVNLAITVGIGNIPSTEERYITRYHQYQPVYLSPRLSLIHFRINAHDAMHFSMALLKEGLAPVHAPNLESPGILVLIVTPHNKPDLYFRTLTAFKTMAETNTLADSLSALTNPRAIWEYINGLNLHISPYVTAHQIMQSPRIAINDTDNLELAIDMLVGYHSRCLPVVDKDNELIGEVSLDEILQVCFPRHILWMDDIVPVLQFESFRNLLNNESSTWLTEIVTHNVATVQLNDPAVKAAIEMTKQETDHVYVLSQKTLVGIITLKNLANIILRQ